MAYCMAMVLNFFYGIFNLDETPILEWYIVENGH